MRARQRKANYELTLGAALGAALRSDGRIRQGGLGRASCRRSGFVLDDHHLSLGPLRRSLGQSPEKGESRMGQIRCKIAPAS